MAAATDDLEALGLPFLVIELRGKIVGYAYATPWRDKPAYRHSVEGTIYLAPDATGGGLGRMLLDALVRACAEAGMSQLVAIVADTGETASRAAHLASGFVEVGRLLRSGHKHGRWIDTVLMQRELGPSMCPSAQPTPP